MSAPYEERHAHILALKDEGLTYRQIAERIGLSRSHVAHIASARTYENQLRDSRERKRQRTGTCEDLRSGDAVRWRTARRRYLPSLPTVRGRPQWRGEARQRSDDGSRARVYRRRRAQVQ